MAPSSIKYHAVPPHAARDIKTRSLTVGQISRPRQPAHTGSRPITIGPRRTSWRAANEPIKIKTRQNRNEDGKPKTPGPKYIRRTLVYGQLYLCTSPCSPLELTVGAVPSSSSSSRRCILRPSVRSVGRSSVRTHSTATKRDQKPGKLFFPYERIRFG